MGFLIDTNVLSELRKKARGNAGVQRWYATVSGDELFLSVLVIGEIRNGIDRLRRRDQVAAAHLERWLDEVHTSLAGRILPVSVEIANRWGALGIPDPLPVVDALLATTALEHDLVLVTRNVRHIETSGVRFLNPFSDDPESLVSTKAD